MRDKILRRAAEVLRIEKEAIEDISQNLDDSFKEAIKLIYSCKGKVVVTGMGKCGIVGRNQAGYRSKMLWSGTLVLRQSCCKEIWKGAAWRQQ